jgi:hypothetical protein
MGEGAGGSGAQKPTQQQKQKHGMGPVFSSFADVDGNGDEGGEDVSKQTRPCTCVCRSCDRTFGHEERGVCEVWLPATVGGMCCEHAGICSAAFSPQSCFISCHHHTLGFACHVAFIRPGHVSAA